MFFPRTTLGSRIVWQPTGRAGMRVRVRDEIKDGVITLTITYSKGALVQSIVDALYKAEGLSHYKITTQPKEKKR